MVTIFQHPSVSAKSRPASRRERCATAVCTAAFLALAAGQMSAATATANLSVTASVTNNCTISTAPVAFGSYDPIVAHASAALDATGTVTVTCTQGAVTTVALNVGANPNGQTRRLASGASRLEYELYKDSSRSTVWSDTGAGVLDTGTAPSSAPRSFTVYGRVRAGQSVPAGSYADTVTATVNF